jgi:SulP family sulfate permease
MCTVMAGVMLVVMGMTGMSSGVKFIPCPIVVDFTNGMAVLIVSTEARDFFGLQLENVPGIFWLRIEALTGHFRTFSCEVTTPAAGTATIMVGCRLVSNRIPGKIVWLVLGTAA